MGRRQLSLAPARGCVSSCGYDPSLREFTWCLPSQALSDLETRVVSHQQLVPETEPIGRAAMETQTQTTDLWTQRVERGGQDELGRAACKHIHHGT